MYRYLDHVDVNYRSMTQKVRVASETWMHNNIHCVSCGASRLDKFKNNNPAADFRCEICNSEFELKSKSGNISHKIVDGAYRSMVDKVLAGTNPHFCLLTYDKKTLEVRNFCVIPKFFFVPAMIEARKPLSFTARRAGWIGCNILLDEVPESGKIFLLRDGVVQSTDLATAQWQQAKFISDKHVSARTWFLDVLHCIERIKADTFSLADMYSFALELQVKHPQNRFINDKIRQQLQLLRDAKYIEFVGRGLYKKCINADNIN